MKPTLNLVRIMITVLISFGSLLLTACSQNTPSFTLLPAYNCENNFPSLDKDLERQYPELPLTPQPPKPSVTQNPVLPLGADVTNKQILLIPETSEPSIQESDVTDLITSRKSELQTLREEVLTLTKEEETFGRNLPKDLVILTNYFRLQFQKNTQKLQDKIKELSLIEEAFEETTGIKEIKMRSLAQANLFLNLKELKKDHEDFLIQTETHLEVYQSFLSQLPQKIRISRLESEKKSQLLVAEVARKKAHEDRLEAKITSLTTKVNGLTEKISELQEDKAKLLNTLQKTFPVQSIPLQETEESQTHESLWDDVYSIIGYFTLTSVVLIFVGIWIFKYSKHTQARRSPLRKNQYISAERLPIYRSSLIGIPEPGAAAKKRDEERRLPPQPDIKKKLY